MAIRFHPTAISEVNGDHILSGDHDKLPLRERRNAKREYPL